MKLHHLIYFKVVRPSNYFFLLLFNNMVTTTFFHQHIFFTNATLLLERFAHCYTDTFSNKLFTCQFGFTCHVNILNPKGG